MKIFNLGKNKENKKVTNNKVKDTRIKILGTDCSKCNLLENNIIEALRILGKSTEIEHITDFARIASYGVMTTPALVVDNKVVSYGKVIKCDEAVELLKDIL